MRGNEYQIGKATKMRGGEGRGGFRRWERERKVRGEEDRRALGVVPDLPANSEVPDGGYGVKSLQLARLQHLFSLLPSSPS